MLLPYYSIVNKGLLTGDVNNTINTNGQVLVIAPLWNTIMTLVFLSVNKHCTLCNLCSTNIGFTQVSASNHRHNSILKLEFEILDQWFPTSRPRTSNGVWTIWYHATKKKMKLSETTYILFVLLFRVFYLEELATSACASLPHF